MNSLYFVTKLRVFSGLSLWMVILILQGCGNPSSMGNVGRSGANDGNSQNKSATTPLGQKTEFNMMIIRRR